ncbi:hypothetical protein ACXWTF_12970 [Thiomicrolovo sp. ZZH C-3]
MKKVTVKIIVSGGIVQEVFASEACDVEVIDHDNLSGEGLTGEAIDKITEEKVEGLSSQEV